MIESPQQYKCLAEIEAEVDAGSQVAAVSDAEAAVILKLESRGKEKRSSQIAGGFYQCISFPKAALKRS